MRVEPTSLMFSRHRGRDRASGVALITTLLLLMLMSGMLVAMVMTVNSDMLINGYYRDFRGSFYAADSGLAVVRQALANNVLATIKPVFDLSTQPILPGAEDTVVANLLTTYGASWTSIRNNGQASSWPATFQLDSAPDNPLTQPRHVYLRLMSCTPSLPLFPGATCASPCPTGCTTPPSVYTYVYNYHIVVSGQARGLQKTTLEESGSITLPVSLTAASTTPASFAAWGMFIDSTPICNGSYLVGGTISGPVFTNDAWNFGYGSNYSFTDTVGSASPTAGFQNSRGSCVPSKNATGPGPSINYTVPPVWGQSKIKLPTDDFNQQRAVIDGIGINTAALTNSDKAAALKDINQAPFSGNGVYLPYSVDPISHLNTFTGGGILVEGNADVKLSIGGTSSSPTQIYTIKQTSPSKTTTITINNTTNTTLFQQAGVADVNINGVPSQRNSFGTPLSPSTMLYVDGSITALSGPGEYASNPAIADHTALTIAASGDVTITGDIRYATEPVTTTQNQIAGTPADTLIPGNDKGQSLGIFTATGDIKLNNLQSDQNLWIDASLATISAGGTGGVVNIGTAANTLTIVGGRIQNALKAIGDSGTTRNVYFDKRYSTSGVAPPWFPSTSIPHPGSDSVLPTTPSFQRLQWVNQTAY